VWAKYEQKGLVMLALSDEGKSTVEKQVESKGMTFPTAAGAKGSRAYGVRGIPAAFLIGWDGRILWQGNPLGGSWEGMLDEALAEASRMADAWEPVNGHELLKKAMNYARKGEAGKAWKEASAVKAKLADADQKDQAAVSAFLAEVEERAGFRTHYAEATADEGRVFEAVAFYEQSAKVFKGAPEVDAWTAEVKRLKKEEKELYSLDKKRVAAVEKAEKGDPEKARESLQEILKKARGTALEAAVRADLSMVAAMAGS
jgi:tetratricopeptide (TPR) repeat protein